MSESLAFEILERFRSISNSNGSEFLEAPQVTAASFMQVCRARLSYKKASAKLLEAQLPASHEFSS